MIYITMFHQWKKLGQILTQIQTNDGILIKLSMTVYFDHQSIF